MTGVELWWLGQSGFRLRDPAGGRTLFIDPYLSPHEGRAWPAPITAAELGQQADIILCTHEHIDHFDQPALRAAAAAAGAGFQLVVPRPIVTEAEALGVPAERVIGAEPGAGLEVGGVSIQPVRARHGIHMSDAYSFGEELSRGLVRYVGYVVEVGGVRVYHAGDCIPFEGQADEVRALAPDIALLPINGRDFYRESERDLVGNMDFREAARLASDLGVRALVPMHWELFPHNRGFPSDLAAYVADTCPDLTVLVIGRGQKLILGPASD